MPDNRMRIAYVHDSPLYESLETNFRNPSHLYKLGFTDVVISDQMSGCLYEITPNLIAKVDEAIDSGLGVWLMDDLFTLPIESDAGCPGKEETWSLTAQAIRDVIESVPQIRGMVFRYGETFESSNSGLKRVNLLDCNCIDCSSINGIDRRRKVVDLLEKIVCREGGKRCILRMWDLSDDGIHANRLLQSKVLSKWGGDPRFFVSVKHTLTDYWRHQPWNPTISEDGPPRLIEFQCEREYEFIGMLPNWQGPEWSQGPIECGERGRTGLANIRPKDWAGSWILPLGGGWSNRHAKSELWADMNLHAALALTSDPNRDAGEILAEWLSLNRFPEESHGLIEKSPELILRLRYLEVWQLIANQHWMPSENWFRDDNFVPGACAKIANSVVENGMSDLLLSERALATSMARSHLLMAEKLPDFEHGEFVIDSYRWALRFAEWTEETWTQLIAKAPLNRAQCKTLLLHRLADDPLPPLSVMD
ncbi:MAG: hypothetical protein QF454_05605 [Candidatus Thalassarchaeaceae archaeon]|nr:hypothetical protein [Candidatus Thalassarchaeaceae archaeon]